MTRDRLRFADEKFPVTTSSKRGEYGPPPSFSVTDKTKLGSSDVLGGLLVPAWRTVVVGFHPAGITAISRGLSVRDTPDRESSRGGLHPEGMLAGSGGPPN